MDVVRNLDMAAWRHFVDEHPAGNIFHTPEMYEVFSQTKGHQPELWAVTEAGRVLALMLPVRITLKDGVFRHFTTRAVTYGSVLCVPGEEGQKACARMLQAYKHQINGNVLFTELRNYFELNGLQPILQNSGFIYEDHLNYLVNIEKPVDEVWNNIKKSARKNIQKAFKKDQLEIIDVNECSQIEICYEIFTKTFATAQVPLVDSSLLQIAFDILYPKGRIKFLLGRIDGDCVAASVALLYKDVIYGWYRGFDRAYSNYLPNDLMVWYILKWGAENGYRIFDFGGAGRPDEEYGPRQFKAKFGGEQVNYGRNVYVHNPQLFRFSKWGYQVFRQFL